jgi:hypothetical protein
VETLAVAMPILNGMALGPQTGVAVISFGEEVGVGVFDRATGGVLRRVGGPPGSQG